MEVDRENELKQCWSFEEMVDDILVNVLIIIITVSLKMMKVLSILILDELLNLIN